MVKHQRRRRTHKRKQQKQRGGGSCAALPMNRQVFAQSGGMAEMGPAFSGLLLDHSTQVQAEVAPTIGYINELPSVIPKMIGGARHRKSHKKARKSHRKSQKKVHKKHHKKSQRRQRGGGMSPFSAPYMLLNQSQYASDATNPQFQTEGSVNSLYGEFRGAQQA